MNEDRTLVIAGLVATLLALIPAAGVLWEVLHVPWNKGPLRLLGRVLLSKSAVIVAVLFLSATGASLAVGGYGRPGWFELLRLLVFSLVIPILWAQWYIYRKARLGGLPDEQTMH